MSNEKHIEIIEHNRKMMKCISSRMRKLNDKSDALYLEHRELRVLNGALIQINKGTK